MNVIAWMWIRRFLGWLPNDMTYDMDEGTYGFISRSTKFLRTDLLLRKSVERRRLEALNGEPDRERDFFDYLQRKRNLNIIGQIEVELAGRA